MNDDVAIRPVEPGDVEAVRDIASASMRASYDLSPREIDAIVDVEFGTGEDAPDDDPDDHRFLAAVGGEPAGFAACDLSGSTPVIEWLHVDPDFRGRGVGTTLFEETIETLRAMAGEEVEMEVVAAAAEGGGFVERFGFTRTGERRVAIGDQTVVAAVYTADGDEGVDRPAGEAARPGGDSVHPGEESAIPGSGEDVTVPESTTTDDGEEVSLGEERLPGTEGPFLRTFADPERSQEVGYYCSACGSTSVSMDSMERLRCGECANEHRATEAYDGAYL